MKMMSLSVKDLPPKWKEQNKRIELKKKKEINLKIEKVLRSKKVKESKN